MKTARWVVVMGLSTLALLACGDGGTSPIQDPIVLQGTLSSGGSLWQGFTILRKNTVVYFRTRELTLSPPSTSPDSVSMGVGLGNPSDGACVTTFRTTLLSNETLAFRLFEGDWCILLQDSGTVPSGSTLEYDVLVEITEFD